MEELSFSKESMSFRYLFLLILVISSTHFAVLNIKIKEDKESIKVQTKVSFKIQGIKTETERRAKSEKRLDSIVNKKNKSKKKEIVNKKVKTFKQSKDNSPTRVSEFDQFFVVEPEFPYLSRVYGETGKVIIQIVTDGHKVLSKKILKTSSYERLDQAALSAIDNAQTKFNNKKLPLKLQAIVEFQILED